MMCAPCCTGLSYIITFVEYSVQNPLRIFGNLIQKLEI